VVTKTNIGILYTSQDNNNAVYYLTTEGLLGGSSSGTTSGDIPGAVMRSSTFPLDSGCNSGTTAANFGY